MLKSIARQRKILPAYRTLHKKERFPIWESSWCSSWSKDSFCSAVILASMATVSKCIPRNVSKVDGPYIFDDLIGALIFSQMDNIEYRLWEQTVEFVGPAVRKLPK